MNLEEVRDKQAVMAEFKETLKRSKLSQAWAADKLGITRAHLSRILNKQGNASLELAIEMKRLTDKVNSLDLNKAV